MRPVGSKYLLEEPLGRGATGTVWRARQREAAGDEAAVAGHPGETVAIKVLKEELAGDPDVVMRFLRERSVLLRLTHTNIVRTRDLVVEGDLLALVMDLVEGPDLHRYLRDNGPFSPVAASLLTAQIADALAASHADGIVHRDLKPANVLLAGADGVQGPGGPGGGDPGGQGSTGVPGGQGAPGGATRGTATGAIGEMRPMLTDFGIARLADSPGLTHTQEFVGTPAYVAPESAEGRPQTSAVDIYGAGILLYELVTGHPPFAGATALEVLHRHLSEEPRRPTTVPDPLWTVIERCLRKSPEERPSAENLARGLRLVAKGIGVHATPADAEAALGVGALLAPDPAPAPVPGTGTGAASGAAPGAPTGRGVAGLAGAAAAGAVAGAAAGAAMASDSGPGQGAGSGGEADPTQVLPPGAGSYDPNATTAAGGSYDPNGATSVMPSSGAGAGPGDGDATRAMPPMPPGPPPQDGPHPWENQLQAARDRNDQTQVQYLAPDEDPLRRRPTRRPGPPPGAYGAQGGQAPAPPYPPQRQPRRREPPPRRYARPPEPPPRRSANPMRIPGLGCLKGCLFTIVILVVAAWLIWNLTPLQSWIADGKSFWNASVDWYNGVQDWISQLGGPSNSGTGSGG